jgi:quercetin dioxygenase-like cupin family protein
MVKSCRELAGRGQISPFVSAKEPAEMLEKIRIPFLLICALSICAMSLSDLTGGSSGKLWAQESRPASAQQEVIHAKDYPLTMNQALGVPAAEIGKGRLHQVDATLVEIPAGGKVAAHRRLAEEMIYIVSGTGYTLMWNGSSGKKVRYDWKEGDLLSPTLNVWRQHFNASTDKPVRYLTITCTPLMQNIFQNTAFIFSNDFQFDQRWEESVQQKPEDAGQQTTGPEVVKMHVGHLLPNLRDREMKDRGQDMSGITITPNGDMAGNRILEMENREFTTATSTTPEHRHLWEVVYYVLKGNGYSYLQREGEPERRIDWGEGDIFIVEANEYHNQRPRGGPGGRFLQIKASGYFERVGIDKFTMQNNPDKCAGDGQSHFNGGADLRPCAKK